MSISNIIGDYWNSSKATLIFCSQDNESVDDCLSRHIDVFDDILNSKIDVSFFFLSKSHVNKITS